MPRPVHPKNNPDAVNEFKKLSWIIKEEIALANNKPLRVMFEDEARFGRISDSRRCWVPLGIRPNVPVQLQLVREYTG